jgi:hypothetical protein
VLFGAIALMSVVGKVTIRVLRVPSLRRLTMNKSLWLFGIIATYSTSTVWAADPPKAKTQQPAANPILSSARVAEPKQPAGDIPFPRLMGMNIGRKHYDDAGYQRQLARLDVVVFGFYKGWKPDYGMAKVVQNLKRLSRNHVLVGQYTCLNESQDNPKDAATGEVQKKLHEMNWWARKADGTRVQWTDQYRAWDINFTIGSKADASGRRYPQWLAEWDDHVLFRSATFDVWYCDNVFAKPRVTADWDGDGKDEDPNNPAVAAAYRAGHRAEWDHIRQIHPGIMLMGNVDGDISAPEYAGQLEGAFLETLMGKKWSIETWAGWPAVMKRYRAAMANTRAPHLVGFNVAGDKSDYRFFRYAFASCLLGDGYFCFTDSAQGYSSVPWFDEYDFKLGTATSKPPAAAWKGGVWRRDFEHGIVLVNPTTQSVTLSVDSGFLHLSGVQAPTVNNGSPAITVVLAAKDGIVLKHR